MDVESLNHLKYPIGKFVKPNTISGKQILEWIHPRIGKQKRRIALNDQGRWLGNMMPFGCKKIQKNLSDFFGLHTLFSVRVKARNYLILSKWLVCVTNSILSSWSLNRFVNLGTSACLCSWVTFRRPWSLR